VLQKLNALIAKDPGQSNVYHSKKTTYVTKLCHLAVYKLTTNTCTCIHSIILHSQSYNTYVYTRVIEGLQNSRVSTRSSINGCLMRFTFRLMFFSQP